MKKIVLAVVAACALSAVAGVRFYPTDLNVRDFGAKGDGVTDDTAAIQAASDKAARCAEAMRVGVAGRNCKRACQVDGPMPRLVFPAGTYLVRGPVFFRRDHQIYGFDGATVKAASPDGDVFVFVGTMRHFVAGLTMEGGARQFLVETHNNESANFKARDCVFRNASVTAVDSHSYRLSDASDSKKRITVGTYRFDKEKGAWVKDERMDSPDLKPYNNSTYFSLEHCVFYDCQRATDIDPDGATFRDLKVVSSVTTGCVFRVANNLHAYDLDVTLARPKGANDLAYIDYLGAHGLLLENSRFKSADGRGICLVHSFAKPSYIAYSLILRSLEVPCGGCPEGAIVQFRNRATPEIVSVTDVNDTTEHAVEAVAYADGMTADDLDAIRRFPQIPSDKTYSIAIGRNSPNVGDRLPPAVARYREPAADVPKAMTSLRVPPCPADGDVLWGPDFGLSEKASDDDTAAMKRLLGEAASRRLATVVLPPRRIVLKEPVTVSGEVTVTAAGIALIEAADDCDILRVESGSRVLLSHLFFRSGRHQLVCEASSDTTVVLDHCFSFDAADTAFVMTAEKGARLKFLADGGVHYHPRWYEGNANAILAGVWLRTLPPKPYGEPFTESVNVINRGKLRFQDILGVPCVFSAIPKGSSAPAGDYRWIDNVGGELKAVFTRFGAEWGGMPPVYNFDGGKVLIEGSYAYFYPRYTAHAAVLTDREPAPGDIRLFGISCGMEVQLWYGGAQVLVRTKPGDEPRPVRAALRRCLVPKAEPCVTNVRVDVSWDGPVGPVKPVNGVGQPPMNGGPREYRMMHYLKEAGIPYARLHDVGGFFGQNRYVDIPNIFRDFDADENDPANYDFAFTDTLMKALDEAGVEPFYRLGVTIENFTELKTYRIDPPRDYAKWARICEHVIRHYTEGWANGFRMKVTYWEIWNEPDNYEEIAKNAMWKAPFAEYIRLYGTVAPYLKAKFPHLKIGGYGSCGFYAAVGSPVERAANSSPRTEYFIRCADEFLGAVRQNGWPLDFFSYHGYSMPDGAKMFAEEVRRRLDGYGFTKTEMSFNEWLCDPTRDSLGTARQAADIAAELIALQNGPCDTAMIYDAKCGVGVYAPLFNPLTEEPHKAYYAFVAFNELRKLGEAVPCATSDAEVWACAARGQTGRALMIANTRAQPCNLEISGFAGATCRIVDADRTWEEIRVPDVLPPQSFVLVATGLIKE